MRGKDFRGLVKERDSYQSSMRVEESFWSGLQVPTAKYRPRRGIKGSRACSIFSSAGRLR